MYSKLSIDLLGRRLAGTLLVLGLTACAAATPVPGPTTLPGDMPPSAEAPSADAATSPNPANTADSTSSTADADLPPAVLYDLGEATIVQDRFPEDSRFRNMPVRLNGVIAVPPGDGGPYPVVVILHGNHPGCPSDEQGHVDPWPCDPELEQPNYRGFGYLTQALADAGYVALSININAENTFGFGEPTPSERVEQVVERHLDALATAAEGGANDFGVDLDGRADPSRLAFIGHSRGAEAAYVLTHGRAGSGLLPADEGTSGEAAVADTEDAEPETTEIATADADAAADDDIGARADDPNALTAAGILMIAPAITFVDPSGGSRVPLAMILPACDADVMHQEGKYFSEGARLAPDQTEWAGSAWLEQANHNAFNDILGRDPFGLDGRPDCATLLDGEVQREFLVRYASDFLTSIFDPDPAAVAEAKARMGLDAAAPAPDTLYGLPARAALLAAAAERQALLIPRAADELATNLAGGSVTAEAVTTHYCEEGYATPEMRPGSEPCKRVNVAIPGSPAMVVLSWSEPGGAWRFALPEGKGDLSDASAISLRAAVDPLSPLNAPGGVPAFSIRLTDGTGKTASVQTQSDEPALGFPVGEVRPLDFFEGDLFTGRTPMTAVRVPFSEFSGIDPSDIREIALVFDQTPSGSLFVGDLEWLRTGR